MRLVAASLLFFILPLVQGSSSPSLATSPASSADPDPPDVHRDQRLDLRPF